MKKLISIIFVFLFAFVLISCTTQEELIDVTPKTDVETEVVEEILEEEVEEEEEEAIEEEIIE